MCVCAALIRFETYMGMCGTCLRAAPLTFFIRPDAVAAGNMFNLGLPQLPSHGRARGTHARTRTYPPPSA